MLQEHLQELADTAASHGTFAFYIHDLATGTRAAVREHEVFAAASVIKLPIMLRLLEMVHEGTASLEQTVHLRQWHKTGGAGILQFFNDGLNVAAGDACTAMIAISDNTATNVLLDVTGIAPVNAMLDRLGCARTRLHRYFGKPEMPGPAGPSPAVPAEIGRLLELVVHREILTPELCEVAMVALRRQNHRALIPRYLPEGTPVAHKTGSLDGVRHDVGIFWRPVATEQRDLQPADVGARHRDGCPQPDPVIFVGMSREVSDLRWTVENEAEITIARAAKLVYSLTGNG